MLSEPTGTPLCFTCRKRPAGNGYAGPYSAYCAECQPKEARPGPRGARICQCPLCFELFSGESTFAWHRIDRESCPTGSPGELWLGECRDPASKGMVLRNGVWGQMTRHLRAVDGSSASSSGTVPPGTVKPSLTLVSGELA